MKPSSQDVLEDILKKTSFRKKDRRRIEIAEASLRVVASLGLEQMSFRSVAEELDVSRPSIQHYFTSQNELVTFSYILLRTRLKRWVTNRLPSDVNRDWLKVYCDLCYDWAELNSIEASAFCQYFLRLPFDRELKEINHHFAQEGNKRITFALDKIFPQQRKQNPEKAKLIQSYILGIVVTSLLEDPMDFKKLRTPYQETIESLLNHSIDGSE